MILPATERIIRFLNMFRCTGDAAEWVSLFRSAFRQLFDDVDRISIDINTECHYLEIKSTLSEPGPVPETASETEHFLQQLQWQDFPVERYHPPVTFQYSYGASGAYLGTLVLWRERTVSPVSQNTIKVINHLQPFLRFVLSHFLVNTVVRNRLEGNSPREVFRQALHRLFADATLTGRERQVVLLLLMGRSYADIAAELDISVNTVRKFVKSIYRKTDVHSQFELFAKYFTSGFGVEAVDRLQRVGNGNGGNGGYSVNPEKQKAERLTAFMNALPETQKSLGLLQALHHAIHTLIGEVQVSSTFDMRFDFRRTEPSDFSDGGSGSLIKTNSLYGAEKERMHIARFPESVTFSERLIEVLRRQGFSDDPAKPPITFDYFHDGRPTGAFLLRATVHDVVTYEDLEMIRVLQPFFTFLFSDMILRHQYAEPMTPVIVDAGNRMFSRQPGNRLNEHEKHILMMQLLGHSYKTIAAEMNISVDTVKRHVKNVHKVMGTGTVSDVFTQYMAPYFGLDELLKEL